MGPHKASPRTYISWRIHVVGPHEALPNTRLHMRGPRKGLQARLHVSAHKLLRTHLSLKIVCLPLPFVVLFFHCPFLPFFRVRSIGWSGSWDHLHSGCRCHGCCHGNNRHSHRLLLLQTTWFLLQHCHTQQKH